MSKQAHSVPALISSFIPRFGQIIKGQIFKGILIWIVRGILCFLFLLISFSGIAQQNKIDSLEKVLKTTKEDTTKVNLLNALLWQYKYIDAAKALSFGEEALKLSQKINFKKGIANSCTCIGTVYEDQSNYDKALDYYLKALKIYEDLIYENGISSVYNNLGNIYAAKGNNSLALEYFKKSLGIYEKTGDKDGIGKTLYALKL